jgi:ferric-dicitrate binding protein FerR (iron transport regulator)
VKPPKGVVLRALNPRGGAAHDPRSDVRELVVLAQRRLTGAPPKRHAASLESVERRLSRQSVRGWRRRRALFGAAASGLVGAACAICLLLANRGEALRVEVLSRSAGDDGREECSRLRFSDGSEVAIGAGALLRIAALRARGAELELQRGSVRVDVANRPGALWRLRAGDYRMDGNGTTFDIDFDPDRQSLEVDLASGSLFVSGPAFQAEVEAGEHLSLQLGRSQASLERQGLIARCSPGDAEPERENQ